MVNNNYIGLEMKEMVNNNYIGGLEIKIDGK